MPLECRRLSCIVGKSRLAVDLYYCYGGLWILGVARAPPGWRAVWRLVVRERRASVQAVAD